MAGHHQACLCGLQGLCQGPALALYARFGVLQAGETYNLQLLGKTTNVMRVLKYSLTVCGGLP